MATNTKSKLPKLFLAKGEAALSYRRKLGMSQALFWSRVGVGQSGGSRYESGRRVPRPVQTLLHLAYAPEDQALAMFNYRRSEESQSPPPGKRQRPPGLTGGLCFSALVLSQHR